MKSIKTIFWDFDGVILNSNEVRDYGFVHVLKGYSTDIIERLLAFHRKNGGLSRYVKFKYLYEEILRTPYDEEDIQRLASEFSIVMRERLCDKGLLFNETVDFIKKNHQVYKMYITSGSDQNELRFLCDKLGLSDYFIGIHGSPKPKKVWISELIEQNNYLLEECMIIGDSINDYEAGKANGIDFMAYNNPELNDLNTIELDLH